MPTYCLLRFEQTFLSIREFSYSDSIIEINISLILILYFYVAIFNGTSEPIGFLFFEKVTIDNENKITDYLIL